MRDRESENLLIIVFIRYRKTTENKSFLTLCFYNNVKCWCCMKEQNKTCADVRSEDISRHMYSAALTGCLSSSSWSGSLSTLGTGGVSWRTRPVPEGGEPVSNAGGDWILLDVLTRSTGGRLLLTRLPLSVKTFPDHSHVTVTGCHMFRGLMFTSVWNLVQIQIKWVSSEFLSGFIRSVLVLGGGLSSLSDSERSVTNFNEAVSWCRGHTRGN